LSESATPFNAADGKRLRPKKLEAWQALRERYGNRDESGAGREAFWPRLPWPSS
jgi:hypothetical protein